MVYFASFISVTLVAATSVSSAVLDPRHYQKGTGANTQGEGCQNKEGDVMSMETNAGGGSQAAAAKTGKAIYFMTNADDNSIVALPILEDGKIVDGSITATGGKGGVQVDPKTGLPTLPDGTASQGAVRVAGDVSCNPGCQVKDLSLTLCRMSLLSILDQTLFPCSPSMPRIQPS